MKQKIKVPEHLATLYSTLQKRKLSALQWAQMTGSTRLNARVFDLRELNIEVKDEWLTLKSGKRIKSYFC